MRGKTTRWLAVLGVFLGLAGLARTAWADDDPDSITITLTPSVHLHVTIATTTVRFLDEALGAAVPGDSLALGTLSLGNTVYMVRPATVTVDTQFANTEIGLRAFDQGLGAWTVDADAVAQQNELQVYVLISSATTPGGPTIAQYDDGSTGIGDQVLTTSERRYGLAGSDSATEDDAFQTNATPALTADENFPAGATSRHMWVRLDTPPATTDGGLKTFTIVVDAINAN